MSEVPASSSAEAAVALYELQDICRSVTGELHTAIGTGAQYRCGICFELASDHIGNTETGCLKKECNSIQSQIDSARAALAQLRSVSKMSAILADIMQKSSQVAADRDAIIKEFSRKVSENRTLTLQVSDLRTEVSDLETEVSDLKTDLDELQTHSSSLDAEINVLSAEVNVLVNQLSDAALARADLIASHTNEKRNLIIAKDTEKNEAIDNMASYLISYISGALPNDTLIGSMQSKFGITISPSIFPPASLPTPTLLVPPIGGFPSTTVGASSISSAGALSTATPGAASVISGVLSSAEPVVGATGVASNGVVPVFSSAAAAGGAVISGSTFHAPAAAAISAAIGPAAAGSDIPDGDKVGKSAKSILVQFKQRDAAVQHLQKESTILSEINLLYGMSSVVTKISIIIKHTGHGS